MGNLFQKRTVKRFLSFCLFLFLCCQVLLHLTYLFRNSGEDRRRILAFKDETPESLDMVYIGASSVFVFWDPMLAWQRCGITSYDYSMSNMPATTYLSAIKEIQKTQSPKVIAVDLRTFTSPVWESLSAEGVNLGGYRSITDSWDISLERAQAISYYCDINNVSAKDSISSYIDLVYYHNNRSVLASKVNWDLGKNTIGDVNIPDNFKGYRANKKQTSQIAMYTAFSPPETLETGEISAAAEQCYRELLEYCVSGHIPLLITASPYILGETSAKQLNTFSQIAFEYGIPVFNANTSQVWQQMDLDPLFDFYNENHVNVIGAEKYTSVLADYLVETFDMPDHRGDAGYGSWQRLYEDSYLPHIKPLKEYAEETARRYQQTFKDEEQMRQSNDAAEWFSLADNENITLLMCANKPLKNLPSYETGLILNSFGLADYLSMQDSSFIGVYSGKVLYYDAGLLDYSGATNTVNPYSGHFVPYSFSIGRKPCITVNEVDYSIEPDEGICIVAIDNNIVKAVDSISVDIEEDGDMAITHINVG